MESIKYDVFIEGKGIDLISLNEDIAVNSNWYNWFNNELTTKGMQKHYFPNNANQQLKFFQTNVQDNINKLQLGIVYKIDNKLIGTISLNNINLINKSCEIAGLIGEKDYRNINNYVEASRLIIIHAFNTLNMHRIYGGTMTKELKVLHCKMLGFTFEGTQKEAIFKDGKYHDTFMIGLLYKDFVKKYKK